MEIRMDRQTLLKQLDEAEDFVEKQQEKWEAQRGKELSQEYEAFQRALDEAKRWDLEEALNHGFLVESAAVVRHECLGWNHKYSPLVRYNREKKLLEQDSRKTLALYPDDFVLKVILREDLF